MNNREIKFRAWNQFEKRFYDKPFLITNTGIPFIYNEEFLHIEDFDAVNPVMGLIIQQFIGLKDSKDKEIYEGDILKEYIANETQTQLGICKSVLGGWKIFSHPDSSICWHGWKQEIIGNIFENPELLENKSFLDKCIDAETKYGAHIGHKL